jgi:glycosyltransferase involved in cell wall biosynthesis
MEVFAVELARQLKARGCDLTVCFEDSPPPAVRDFLLQPGNLTLDVMPNQVGMGLRQFTRFWRLLRQYRPGVILYSLGGAVRWWPLLGRLAGAHRIVYYDQTSRTQSQAGYKAAAHVRLLMRPLSYSVCATRFIKACSDGEEIVPPHKSLVLYSAVDTTKPLGSGQQFRRRYAIPDDRIVVLQVSWLVPEKGIDIALRAAASALAVRQDLHFVFCGDGGRRKEYEQIAADIGIADRVTWTGQVEDLTASGAFRAADIQIQCSQWKEAFCLAVAEGMSAGVPVIASRIGGLPELVTDGVNGILFEPSSVAELASAILKLAADPDLRARMGQQGRSIAIAKHDLKANVASWVDLLLADTRPG